MNLISAIRLIAEYTGDVRLLLAADTLRERIAVALDLLRKVAAKTETGADDAVLSVVERIGVDKAAEAIEAILGLFDAFPGPQPAPFPGPVRFGAAAPDRNAAAATAATQYGLNIAELMVAAKTVADLIQLLRGLFGPKGVGMAAPQA
jgi:hypothetical protein